MAQQQIQQAYPSPTQYQAYPPNQTTAPAPGYPVATPAQQKFTADGVPIVNWGKTSVRVPCPLCGVNPTTTYARWTQSGANWGIASICPCFMWFGETDAIPAVDNSRGYKHDCIHCNKTIGFYPCERM